MKKFIVLALSMFVFMSSCTNAAEENWKEEFSFPVKKIVDVPAGRNDFDHKIYSFKDGDGLSSLLFVCHGAVTSQNEYVACLGGKYYRNYAAAVDNEIRYHIFRGEIRQGSFDKVYFLTCYSGYAPKKITKMPVLRKNLQMALYSRDAQAFEEHVDNNWRVYYLTLYRNDPYGGNLGGTNSSGNRNIIRAGNCAEE